MAAGRSFLFTGIGVTLCFGPPLTAASTACSKRAHVLPSSPCLGFSVMLEPWGQPPIPLRGDNDENATYAGIGRVTSKWEEIEFELSNLCHDFANGLTDDGQRAYGEGKIFSNRLEILVTYSKKFFVSRCSQDAEGIFYSLAKQAQQFSLRRHEVAHGIVFDISVITFFKERMEDTSSPQWAVVAPYYAARHHASDGLPRFAYASPELNYIMRMMNRYFCDLHDYRGMIAQL